MKAKIDALLAEYPDIDTAAMGFPRGWESEPLWQYGTSGTGERFTPSSHQAL
jgi:hypothetical protein